MSDVTAVLMGLELSVPASSADVQRLVARYPWLPSSYLECLRWANGGEGYVQGRGYLRLWSVEAALGFQTAYNLSEFLPTVFLFGTDASVTGYGFDSRTPGAVVSVELAALDDEYLRVIADSFPGFVAAMAQQEPPPMALESFGPPEWLRGQVIHEKHPIVLGGSARDESNRVLVPEQEHPQLAAFFTRTLKTVRAQTLKRTK